MERLSKIGSESGELVGATLEDLEKLVREFGEQEYRARQLAKWIHQKGKNDFAGMSDLPSKFRLALEESGLSVVALHLEKVWEAEDGTKKYLFRLHDGEYIEGVYIPEEKRKTVCFSTQVGCQMGCAFCATGKQGWTRNLSAGEIVDQVRTVGLDCGQRITHAVAMGQGEPLANYDAVLKGIRIMNADYGLGIAARRLTISTCGLAPAIRRLADEEIQINLAVSLHSTNDQTRDRLVPVNRVYPLAQLLVACCEYTERTKRRITLEYTMIKGVNDSEEELTGLAQFSRGWLCHVNLIPYNPIPDPEQQGISAFRPSDPNRVRRFFRVLTEEGVAVSIRERRGDDIWAACGQLRAPRRS